MDSKQHEKVTEFVEQMGMIAQGDGLPRIAGKILGLLIVETGPFSFSELAERLHVSRASISTNTRLLENLGVIDRVSVPAERGDYFKLAEDPYARMLQRITVRMKKSLAIVQDARSELPSGLKESQRKLKELETFYSEYLSSTEKLIQSLKTSR